MKAPCADYVIKKVKLCNTYSVDARNLLRRKTRGDTTRQCSKESSLGPFEEKWDRTHGKMIWAHPRRSSRKWRSEVLWVVNFQSNSVIEARRPNKIVTDKRERKGIVNDIFVPVDVRLVDKEKGKVENCQD